MRSGISVALSLQRMAVKTAGQPVPVKAVKPAEPGARSASLDGRRLVRQRLARPNGAARPNRAASLAHCADLLSTKEDLAFCNVRRCQKNCDKVLHYLTIDRGAPWSLYPAIKRSVVCTSPVLRYPSPNCDQAKARRSAQAADFVQTHCSRYADHWVGRLRVMFAKSTEARMQEPRPPYRLFADPMRDRFGNLRYCGERTRERTWRYRRE
jgi:hypothetical protein